METLKAILDEAENDPFTKNTTVLNKDQFRTIRGPSSPTFRSRVEAALHGSGDLIEVQRHNTEYGLEVIQPIKAGINGGCWYLCNLIHRGETFPAGEVRYRSIVDALEAAIEWWQGETWCRGVVVRVYDINQAIGAE